MKVLLVGHGRWGSLLRERLDAKLGVENVWVADAQEDRLPKGHIVSTNYLELIGSPRDGADGVVVATLPWQHYEIALEAFQRGKHVLVEKPLTMDVSQAKILQHAAAVRGLTLMTDDTWQYASSTRGLIDSGWEGQDLLISWSNPHPGEAPRGGILWTQGPHPISVMMSLLGGKPKLVEGGIDPRRVNLKYTFPDGRTAEVHMAWDVYNKVREITWRHGTPGRPVPDGAGFVSMNAQLLSPGEDPVSNMLDKFLRSLKKPWVDDRAVDVVEVLEWSQSQINASS